MVVGRGEMLQGNLGWEMAPARFGAGKGAAGAEPLVFHITSGLRNFLCSGGASQRKGEALRLAGDE